jgi:hypothetical protein
MTRRTSPLTNLAATGLLFLTTMMGASSAQATGLPHDHGVPALSPAAPVSVEIEPDRITITFGPLDLPTGHEGELAASLPPHVFQVPRDTFLTGFHASLSTTDGTPLPRHYLHHLLLIDPTKESPACPGEVYFLAGAGLEMSDARFPDGYGVEIKAADQLMAVVAFYHGAPATTGVVARFTLHLASAGIRLTPLQVYHVGINVGCYRQLDRRAPGETDEGLPLAQGLSVVTAPVTFRIDGCVKYAYPHGHDHLVLFTLENRTSDRTLLRTAPDTTQDGALIGFPASQVYRSNKGFSVSKDETYEMTMISHRPLHDQIQRYGMANYILYLTPGPCSEIEPDEFERAERTDHIVAPAHPHSRHTSP